jgi:hypothetical protein
VAKRGRAFVIEIVADSKKAGKQFDSFGRSMAKTLGAIGIGLGAREVTRFIGDSVKAAAALENLAGGTRAVFGSFADEAIRAAEAANSIGLSDAQYLTQLNYFGNLSTAIGYTKEASLGISQEFIQLGSDFAAFFDAKPEQVIDALASATRGEYDALQRYLPTISAARIEEEKVAVTRASLVPLTDDQAKLQAILNIAYQDGGAAIGAYARESDSLSTAMARFDTYKADAMVAFGQGVIEPFAKSAGSIDAAGKAWVDFNRSFGQAAGNMLSQSSKVQVALDGTTSSLSIAEKAQHGWNLALSAGNQLLPGVSLVTDRFRADVTEAGDATADTADEFNKFPYLEFQRGMTGAATATGTLNKALWTAADYSRSDFLTVMSDGVVRLTSKWYDLAEQIRRANAQLKGTTGRQNEGYYGDRFRPTASVASVSVNFNGVVGDPIEAGRQVVAVLNEYGYAGGVR